MQLRSGLINYLGFSHVHCFEKGALQLRREFFHRIQVEETSASVSSVRYNQQYVTVLSTYEEVKV